MFVKFTGLPSRNVSGFETQYVTGDEPPSMKFFNVAALRIAEF